MKGQKNRSRLYVNGEELEIKTHAHTVGKLLSEQEIEVAEHDVVTPSVNTPIEDGLIDQVGTVKQVAIQVDQEKNIHLDNEEYGRRSISGSWY